MARKCIFSLFNLLLPVSLAGAASVAATRPTPAVEKEALAGGVPADWWARVQKDIQQSEYEITWQEAAQPDSSTGARRAPAGYQAPNRAHGFRAHFMPDGVRVVPRAPADQDGATPWEWGIELTAYGDKRQPLAPARLSVSANRIEYLRGDLTEWYVNDERGLEQGFTLNAPPGSPSDRPSLITLEMRVSGSLTPVPADDGQSIDFSTPAGDRVVRYAGLQAQDATGQPLPAKMALGDSLRLVVDATSATYPITIDPLASNPDWTVESNQANSYYGWSVATAGDVNGDGYDDVIVGAPFYDNGQALEGKAWVYEGSASGLSSSARFRPEGNQPGASFGYAVATAGDVNGDGYDDVIVGGTCYSNGQYCEGKVWVYHGSRGGLVYPAAFQAEGNQANARYGYSVAAAGDVNGDGYGDVIVGQPYYSNGQASEGKVWAYHGSPSGLIPSPAFQWEGNQANARYGYSVATAGDVNGDGYDDVIVGQPYYTNGQNAEGKVWVYRGSVNGLLYTAVFQAEGNQVNAHYGWSVATAGDVNGDGYGDVIVGAPDYSNGQAWEGKVWAYHGSGSGLIPSPAFQWEGNQANSGYGESVATAGDVNGDGYDDVIVGQPFFANGQDDEGKVWVYRGSVNGLLYTAIFQAEGNSSMAHYGRSVATAGDVNGDGYDDVIVGAPKYTNPQIQEGRVDVYHGPL